MADHADTMKLLMRTSSLNALRSSMTPMERASGRFMRAPDHGDAPADPAPADPVVADPPASDPAPASDGTILGGDPVDPDAPPVDPDAPADPAAPEGAPETYELSAPEGTTIAPEMLEMASSVFKELGLNNEQANKLMPVAAEFAKSIQTQGQQHILGEVQAQRRAWAEEAQNDQEIGGTKWDETQHLSAKALDALGYPKGSPFRSFLTDSGLGNHPEMIRAMRKVGQLVSEDGDFVRGTPGAQAKRSAEEILYPNQTKAEGA